MTISNDKAAKRRTISASHGDQAVVRRRGQRVQRPVEVHGGADARRRALFRRHGPKVIMQWFSANPSVEVVESRLGLAEMIGF